MHHLHMLGREQMTSSNITGQRNHKTATCFHGAAGSDKKEDQPVLGPTGTGIDGYSFSIVSLFLAEEELLLPKRFPLFSYSFSGLFARVNRQFFFSPTCWQFWLEIFGASCLGYMEVIRKSRELTAMLFLQALCNLNEQIIAHHGILHSQP